MRVETFASLSQIVSYIEEYYFSEGNVLFRGQAEDWPLRPGIARLKPRKDYRFTEETMLRAFQRRSLPFLEMVPETDWEWLAVAQHFGLPTRLLDWTVNALAALWFAVQKPPASERDGALKPGVLWIFKPVEGQFEKGSDYFTQKKDQVSPFAIDRPGVLVPRYVSKRIVAQGGYFTIHPNTDAPPHFAPFELQYAHRDERFVKIIIPPEAFPKIRHHLSRLGMNSMSIYPDLEGLCKDITWRYAYKDDESDKFYATPASRETRNPADLEPRT